MPLNRRADIQWNDSGDCGCLRVGDGDYSHLRHLPYHRACTVFRRPDGVAELQGWAKASTERGIDVADWWAIGLCLAAEGFEHATFERFAANGQPRHVGHIRLARFRRHLQGS